MFWHLSSTWNFLIKSSTKCCIPSWTLLMIGSNLPNCAFSISEYVKLNFSTSLTLLFVVRAPTLSFLCMQFKTTNNQSNITLLHRLRINIECGWALGTELKVLFLKAEFLMIKPFLQRTLFLNEVDITDYFESNTQTMQIPWFFVRFFQRSAFAVEDTYIL